MSHRLLLAVLRARLTWWSKHYSDNAWNNRAITAHCLYLTARITRLEQELVSL